MKASALLLRASPLRGRRPPTRERPLARQSPRLRGPRPPRALGTPSPGPSPPRSRSHSQLLPGTSPRRERGLRGFRVDGTQGRGGRHQVCVPRTPWESRQPPNPAPQPAPRSRPTGPASSPRPCPSLSLPPRSHPPCGDSPGENRRKSCHLGEPRVAGTNRDGVPARPTTRSVHGADTSRDPGPGRAPGRWGRGLSAGSSSARPRRVPGVAYVHARTRRQSSRPGRATATARTGRDLTAASRRRHRARVSRACSQRQRGPPRPPSGPRGGRAEGA